MKRLLITGGQGFIGRYLAAHWLTTRETSSVVCVGRSAASAESFTHRVTCGRHSVQAPLPRPLRQALLGHAYEYCSVDLTDRNGLIRLLARFRPDAVVHLAGALRDDSPERLLTSNVSSVVGLLEAIVGARVEVGGIVLGSSCAAYGLPRSLPIREDAPTSPLEPYAASKLAAEQLGRALANHHGLPLVVARIFNPIGPGQDERHFCAAICGQAAAIRSGSLPRELEVSSLSATRDFIDVRDVAAALALLVERGMPGECYNVGSGQERAIEDVFRRILELAGLQGSVSLKRRPPRKGEVSRHFADTTRIEGLGFRPRTTLDESLADMLAYYTGPVASVSSGHAAEAREPRAEFGVHVTARHAYSVVVERGLLKRLPVTVSQMFPDAAAAVLTDEHVQTLYGQSLIEEFRQRRVKASSLIVPRGEAAKSRQCFDRVVEQLYTSGFDRRALLINLGGGAICDLGGFVASCYLRGVQYLNVPTTLLAQHDAAIGGKVALNTAWAKNFVGAFHHPAAVFCDPVVLQSLDARALAAGITEAVKVAICGEPELFSILEREANTIVAERNPAVLAEVVRRAARAKIELLAADPLEVDLRRVLNLGHTFGHALETELGYDSILHGEAVAFGLAVAVQIAVRRGVCPETDAERILALLHAYGLPPKVSRTKLAASSERLSAIRLARAQRLLFVLPTSVSSVAISDEIADSEFQNAIDELSRHHLLADRVSRGLP